MCLCSFRSSWKEKRVGILILLMTKLFNIDCFSFVYLACYKDGILLLEVNRILRAGGYFAWAAQPVYKHEENLQEQWKGSSLQTSYSKF